MISVLKKQSFLKLDDYNKIFDLFRLKNSKSEYFSLHKEFVSA